MEKRGKKLLILTVVLFVIAAICILFVCAFGRKGELIPCCQTAAVYGWNRIQYCSWNNKTGQVSKISPVQGESLTDFALKAEELYGRFEKYLADNGRTADENNFLWVTTGKYGYDTTVSLSSNGKRVFITDAGVTDKTDLIPYPDLHELSVMGYTDISVGAYHQLLIFADNAGDRTIDQKNFGYAVNVYIYGGSQTDEYSIAEGFPDSQSVIFIPDDHGTNTQ